jgi:hypothetical protein
LFEIVYSTVVGLGRRVRKWGLVVSIFGRPLSLHGLELAVGK